MKEKPNKFRIISETITFNPYTGIINKTWIEIKPTKKRKNEGK